MTVLEASGLTLAFQGRAQPVLHDVSLKLSRGERVALVGRSGAGKTSLLRVLEGTRAPDAGSVSCQGRVALVYQDQRLVPERTVLDNVCMGALAELDGVRSWWEFSSPIRERALGLLQELGIGHLAASRVSALSGGEAQRVAIARALCAKPAVLLADEPLSALDEESAKTVLELLARLQAEHDFALVVTVHNTSWTEGFFHRTVRLSQGELGAERASPSSNTASTASPALGRGLWALLGALFVLALIGSAWSLGLTPALLPRAGQGLWSFFGSAAFAEGTSATQMPWGTLLRSLLQTLQMALWGTTLGAVASLPLAFLAVRSVSPRGVRDVVRFGLNVVRTVPSIFWALIFVAMLGLGPTSGVFALAAYSTGYLTKFFYEALEDADARAANALRALGATPMQAFVHATLPKSRTALLAAVFFVFEYNVRAASILGVVGAGGIGQHLMYYIEWRNFAAASMALVLLLVVVVGLDALSARLRVYVGAARGS